MSQAIVLASASPRRARLLALLGVSFEIDAGAVDEDLTAPGDGIERAQELALDKARAVAARHPDALVLGADTLISFRGRLLGKPRDAADAQSTLSALRGRWHQVMTGLAVVNTRTGQEITGVEVTRVLMRRYSDEEIAAYVATGDPMDKAASYAVQHRDFHPVARLDVCYTNVMGLPVCATLEILSKAGARVRSQGQALRTPRCSFCQQVR
jgi:septum formation protein